MMQCNGGVSNGDDDKDEITASREAATCLQVSVVPEGKRDTAENIP